MNEQAILVALFLAGAATHPAKSVDIEELKRPTTHQEQVVQRRNKIRTQKLVALNSESQPE